MGRDPKSAGGEDLDVGFRKLPEYRRRNGLSSGRGGGGGREIAVEVVGKGGGRDGGGERRGFHFERGSDGHVSRPKPETNKAIFIDTAP